MAKCAGRTPHEPLEMNIGKDSDLKAFVTYLKVHDCDIGWTKVQDWLKWMLDRRPATADKQAFNTFLLTGMDKSLNSIKIRT